MKFYNYATKLVLKIIYFCEKTYKKFETINDLTKGIYDMILSKETWIDYHYPKMIFDTAIFEAHPDPLETNFLVI